MLIIIATISILGLTALIWFLNRISPIQICPICAGVSGTWLGLIALHLAGYQIDLVVPAILMGGSAVGIAYQLEKKLPAEKSALLWKTLFIPAGFIAAYSILMQWLSAFLVSLIFLLQISFIFLSPRKKSDSHDQKVDELEKKMKNCC